nr:MAG TPA: minor tail protein [Caudoviricetes sp.]
MAGGYDGEIRIKTKIENADMSSQLMQLENRMEKTARKAQQLEDAMREMESRKIPTEEYKEVQTQIQKAQDKLSGLNDRMEKFLELGGKKSSTTFKNMQYDMADLENTIAYAKGELEAMEEDGTAFKDVKATEEYRKLSDQLGDTNREMAILSKKHDEIIDKQKKVGSGAKQIEKVGKSAKKSAGLMSTLLSRLKGIALSLLIFNWITKAFNAMVESFKTGIQNMAKYSGSFNERMSSLKSSIATLNAALGTLAAPIVSMVTPALARLCDWLTKAINAMNQFIALLSGQSTWTRAKQQQVDYAKSLEKTSGVAKKTAGALAAFDDLNVLQKNDSGGSGSSTAGMYEEVQVSDKMASKLGKVKDLAKQIKEVFSVGWKKAFEKLGIDGQVQNIRSNLASIKDSFIDIFSADSVKNAAGNFAVTFVTSLGTIAASFVSIGATIAQNLTGGIKKYLDDNKDDIKKHLTQMFDIGADILLLAASAAAAFALIFSAFGSDSGQQLTANLIQMFSDAFLSVSAIAAQFADDILHLLLDPFVNNQDDIVTAVQGIIDVLAVFSGTVADIVGQVGDGFRALYSNYISPFISHFTDGISDLLGSFLNFWNNNMQPVLMQWASMFDDTYQSHLKPMIDAFMELLGVLIEYIQLFWDNYLKAPLQWIIEHVLPMLQPILEDLGKQVKLAVDIIADVITTMIKVIKGVFAILGDLIRGDWKKLWEDAKQIFKDIVNGILSIAETMANGLVDAINRMVQSINSIKFDVPDWIPGLGGKSFGGFNIPEVPRVTLPRLANGGITTGATLAEIGEAGREAVLPLEKNTGWMDALADKIADRMSTSGGTVDASLILDGETCGRLFLPYIQNEEVRLGIAEG